MRSSSLPQRFLGATDAGQYSLPYPAEAEDSAIDDKTDHVSHSHLSGSSPMPPTLGNSGTRKPHPPRRARKNGERKPPANATVPPQAKLLVSREEAAQLLSISVRGVDYLVADKRLSARRIGTRVLIPIEDVRKFARSDHPERLAG
ncbi:MAG: helix-turn-helix domain-containing protein [Terracidiphilus sp.]